MNKSKKLQIENNSYQIDDKNLKVLLIEDDPEDILIIKELLDEKYKLSIKLESVSYLSKALNKISSNDISIIILDLFLPDSHGLDTLIKIREYVPEIPIIILTGMDNEDVAYQAAQEGAQDYLIKGQMDSKTLVRSIRYAIERQRAEKALKESENKYRNLIESSPDIIWSFSTKRGLIYTSSRVENILGYSPDHLYQNPWLWQKLIHPNDRKIWKEALKITRYEKTIDIQYRIKDIKGNWRRFHDRSIDKYKKNDEIIINGISTDITQRKQYEHRLELADRIISTVDNLVIVADKSGKITFASPSVKRVLGYTEHEVIGNNWWKITRKNDNQYNNELKNKGINRKIKHDNTPYERIAYDKNGIEHCILWQDARGPRNTIISIGIDITSHKKTEYELSRLASLVEQAGESIIITDT